MTRTKFKVLSNTNNAIVKSFSNKLIKPNELAQNEKLNQKSLLYK